MLARALLPVASTAPPGWRWAPGPVCRRGGGGQHLQARGQGAAGGSSRAGAGSHAQSGVSHSRCASSRPAAPAIAASQRGQTSAPSALPPSTRALASQRQPTFQTSAPPAGKSDAPRATPLAARLSAVSSSATATTPWATIGPWSSSAVTKCTVAPASRQPASSALMCAAPEKPAAARDGY